MRERRRRPRLATLEQGEDGPGGSVDRRGQHDDAGGVDWGEREAARGCLDAGKRAQSGAQATELDAEPGPMRLVGSARPEDALDEAIAGDVGRPGFCEGADQSEQDRASGERDTASRTANRAPAGIDDEVAGREQGLDLIQADRAYHAGANEASRRRRQGAAGATDLGDQGRDAGGDGGSVGAVERGRGVRHPDTAERELAAGELDPGCERRRRIGGGDVDRGERLLGGFELADEELAARPDQAGVERVGAIAERVERLRGGVERARRPAQVARGERDLGLGDLAAGLGESLSGAEAARGAPQELARPLVVAELGHRDTAQGERRRVVAQRDALERTERITGRQRARGRGDEGVHGGRIVWARSAQGGAAQAPPLSESEASDVGSKLCTNSSRSKVNSRTPVRHASQRHSHELGSDPVGHKGCRANFPSSRRASARPFWRGQAASLRRITEAVTVPVLIDRARRSSSNQ